MMKNTFKRQECPNIWDILGIYMGMGHHKWGTHPLYGEVPLLGHAPGCLVLYIIIIFFEKKLIIKNRYIDQSISSFQSNKNVLISKHGILFFQNSSDSKLYWFHCIFPISIFHFRHYFYFYFYVYSHSFRKWLKVVENFSILKKIYRYFLVANICPSLSKLASWVLERCLTLLLFYIYLA